MEIWPRCLGQNILDLPHPFSFCHGSRPVHQGIRSDFSFLAVYLSPVMTVSYLDYYNSCPFSRIGGLNGIVWRLTGRGRLVATVGYKSRIALGSKRHGHPPFNSSSLPRWSLILVYQPGSLVKSSIRACLTVLTSPVVLRFIQSKSWSLHGVLCHLLFRGQPVTLTITLLLHCLLQQLFLLFFKHAGHAFTSGPLH
jgi:hypothetical protein